MNNTENIEKILKAKEKRFYYQKQLMKEYGKTLIVLKLNIPGPEKNTLLYRKIFYNGWELLKNSLRKKRMNIIFEKICNTPIGLEGFIVVDANAIKIKMLCIEIEETDGLGRIYDFDVMDCLGNFISRESIGKDQRKCFLCNEYVWVCARTRAHGVDELLAFIEKTAKTYFIKNKREELRWE